MPKAHLVLVDGPSGIEFHSLKPWLREHPEELPSGMSPDRNTSHQLRSALKKRGWLMNETTDEVRLSKPQGGSVPEELLEPEDAEAPSDDEFGFALESELRDFIARNLQTIVVGSRKLRLFKDGTGREGIEYPTGVGPIDILAVDEAGNFFVFELKLGRGPDRAMGQLLRYMGWVKKSLAGIRDVHGIIVAKSIHEKLHYAAFLVPNVSLLEYEIDFKLRQSEMKTGAASAG